MKMLAQDCNSILGAAARSWTDDRTGPTKVWGVANEVIVLEKKHLRTMSVML